MMPVLDRKESRECADGWVGGKGGVNSSGVTSFRKKAPSITLLQFAFDDIQESTYK